MFLDEKKAGEPAIAEPTLAPWQKALLGAANLIEEKGHCKNAFYDNEGRFCLVGAILKVLATDLDPNPTTCIFNTYIFNDALDALIQYGINPPYWNDAPERTAEEVISTLRACAREGV